MNAAAESVPRTSARRRRWRLRPRPERRPSRRPRPATPRSRSRGPRPRTAAPRSGLQALPRHVERRRAQDAELGTITGYTDTRRTNGTTYYYKVTARNGSATSAARRTSCSGRLRSLRPTPRAPSKPGGMDQLVGGHQPAGDRLERVDRQRRRHGLRRLPQRRARRHDVTTTYFLDSGLAANTIYTYQVRAIDAAGNRSTGVEQPQREDGDPDDGSRRASSRASPSTRAARGSAARSRRFTPSNGVDEDRQREQQGRLVDLEPRTPAAGTLTVSAPGHATQTFTVHVVGGKTVLAYADADLGALISATGAGLHRPASVSLRRRPVAHATMRAADRNTESRNNGRLG